MMQMEKKKIEEHKINSWFTVGSLDHSQQGKKRDSNMTLPGLSKKWPEASDQAYLYHTTKSMKERLQ